MSTKTISITIGVVALLMLLGVLYFWSGAIRNTAPATATAGGQLPVAGGAPNLNETSGASTMAVLGAGGSTVKTLDFLTEPTTVEDASNPGLYHIGTLMVASATPPYDITYQKATQYFNVSLLSEPIGQTRVAMEQSLMSKLGITQAAMCQLNYMVSTPWWANQFYSGENLGFSFCPGATQLP